MPHHPPMPFAYTLYRGTYDQKRDRVEAHPVRGGGQDLAVEALHVPTALAEIDGQPVE